MKTINFQLKTIALCILFLIGAGVQSSNGAMVEVTFDFDSLSALGDSDDIEIYMEGVLNDTLDVDDSEVTVRAIVGPYADLPLNAVLWDGLGSGDRYIRSDVGGEVDEVTIEFHTVSIASVISFDWGTTKNPFVAEGGSEEFFSSQSSLLDWGDFSDPYTFASPVNTLSFHNGGRGNVGIDNLVINTVPVPGALWLLGSLLGVLGIRKTIYS